MTHEQAVVGQLQQALCEGRLADFAALFAPDGCLSYGVGGHGVGFYISGGAGSQQEVIEHARAWLAPTTTRQLVYATAEEVDVDRSPHGKYAGEFKDGEHYMIANFTYEGVSAVDGRPVVCTVLSEVTLNQNLQVKYMQVAAMISLA